MDRERDDDIVEQEISGSEKLYRVGLCLCCVVAFAGPGSRSRFQVRGPRSEVEVDVSVPGGGG